MSGRVGEGLRAVRDLETLVEFFREALEWPVNVDDLEKATFDWDPDELGIPSARVPSLKRLRELRPLTSGQPWGVFFIEFDGPRLPITPLRRLLQSLVTKKRGARDGGRRTWDLDDLLFVVTTTTDEALELHLIAFREASGKVEIRSLAWRPGRSPERHLRRLSTELLPRLAWPTDPTDIGAWRARWRDAFKLRHGEPIESATRLAERMADTALDLRAVVSSRLVDERGVGPFTSLMEEVRVQLVADLDEDRFSDMCAQTLVYGVLSSRVTDPESFGASPSLSTVPLSNPFLSAFFEQIHDHVVDLEQTGGRLDALVDDLRETNVEAILDQFGSTAKGADPVIHFYEEFLKRYDRKMRADAGAFYTPKPVVAFMVRSVDRMLKTCFGLPLGVADVSPWSHVAEQLGVEVPNGVDPRRPFLSMIDPATGTGTFLVEWLRRARISFLAADVSGHWAAHVRHHLLHTMHAFELMLGPYSIAHLKVALELHDESVSETEATILLTDTLDHSPVEEAFQTMRDALAVEGELASRIKDNERFTVVIGNPPYDREQRSSSDSSVGRRKGGVVRHGVPGIRPLLGDVIEPMRNAGLGQHVKNLYNDYVYFWRWATWQTTQLPDGPGIVAFITAASYLDGVSMGGLRHHLRDRFDELWIVDLGGEGRGARPEENVFDIRTPVAVALGMRNREARSDSLCVVRYRRLRGTRQEKFDQLDELELVEGEFEVIEGEGLARFTPRSDAEYHDWPEITDLFPWVHSGCQLKRTWPIAPTRELLMERWSELVDAPTSAKGEALRATGFRTIQGRYRPLLKAGERLKPVVELNEIDRPEAILRYGYRSFDRQWVIADSRLADRPRPPLWAARSDQQIYLTTLTSTRLGTGPVVTATPYVPDLDHFSGRGAKNIVPLYRDAEASEPNVTTGLCELLSTELGVDVGPLGLASYVYGITATPAFSQRFATELGEGAGPVRIPISADPGLWRRAIEIGQRLLWLHTWGERCQPDSDDAWPQSVATVETPVTGRANSFDYIEDEQRLLVGNGVFGHVSPEVWGFEVSGYRVVRSWLGYRMAEPKGRKSSPLDDIGSKEWTFTEELLLLLAVIEGTLNLTPHAGELIDAVLGGPLLDSADLPSPADHERRAPR